MPVKNILNNKTASLTINEEYTFPTVDGSANQLLQTNGSGVVSWVTSTASTASLSPYIVGSTNSDYTTIQAAINAANTAGGNANIYIKPGTYTENLTFYQNINIIGMGGYGTEEVKIVGSHDLPGSGECLVKGVSLSSTTDIFDLTTGGSCDFALVDCNVLTTNGFIVTGLGTSGSITLSNVQDVGSTLNEIVNQVGTGPVKIVNCQLGAGSATFTSYGNTTIYNSTITAAIILTTSTTASSFIYCSYINGYVYTTGAHTVDIKTCYLSNGSSPVISHTGTAPLYLNDIISESTAASAIDGVGTGTVYVSSITFIGNSTFNASLTVDYSDYFLAPNLKLDPTVTGILGSTAGTVSGLGAMANGTLLIGDGSGLPSVATLSSSGSTIAITNGAGSINLETGSAVAKSFSTDSGTATPSSGALTITGGTNTNTSGSGSTVSVNLDGNVLGLTRLTVDNLDINGNAIIATNTNGNLVLYPDGSGHIYINNAYYFPNADGDNEQVLITNGSGAMSFSRQNYVQQQRTQFSSLLTLSTQMPIDTSIPQNTEGTAIVNLSITPKNASSVLLVEVNLMGTASGACTGAFALFRDSTANAISATITNRITTSSYGFNCCFRTYVTASSTSSTTFYLRGGPNDAVNLILNGSGSGTLIHGGVASCCMTITELKA